MLVEELKEFGLSEKEAKVYLALLELEVATVQEIAKAADVNRSSAYVVLESLKKRGLVSVSGGKAVQKYVVAPPDRLLRIAEQAAKERVNVSQKMNAILPDLKALYKGTKQRPNVRIYTGEEGLISSFEETLKTKEKLLRIVSSVPDIHASLPDYLPTYVEKRMRLGIKMLGIHPYEPVAQWMRENMTKGFDDVQLIPKERWNFTADFVIYDNTIGYILHQEGTAITIEEKDVADGMKKIFDLAFKEAKRINVKDTKKRPKA